MTRRSIVTTVVMGLFIVVAAGVAIGANLGILHSTDDGSGPVGELSPVIDRPADSTSSTGPEVQTVYVDEYVHKSSNGSTVVEQQVQGTSDDSGATESVSTSPSSSQTPTASSVTETETEHSTEVEHSGIEADD